MSNRFASFDAPHAPAPLHRYGGRVQATRELAISPVAGDLFVVEGLGPVYALPPSPRGPVITLLTATAIPFVHSSKLQLPGAVDLLTAANDALMMVPVADGAWQCVAHLRNAGYRERLVANRTYYVRTDGSDSNDGLSNSASGAFLTIQKAINVIAALDISTFNVTIQLADGTYSAGASVGSPWVGSGTVTLTGNSGTPANVVLDVSGTCVQVSGFGSRLSVSNFAMQGGVLLRATNGGFLTRGAGLIYGTSTNYQVYADLYGLIVGQFQLHDNRCCDVRAHACRARRRHHCQCPHGDALRHPGARHLCDMHRPLLHRPPLDNVLRLCDGNALLCTVKQRDQHGRWWRELSARQQRRLDRDRSAIPLTATGVYCRHRIREISPRDQDRSSQLARQVGN